jgi:FdhD protein
MIREEIRVMRVTKYEDPTFVIDKVARDVPFCIFLDDIPFKTLITSPMRFRELVLGHLLTEGVIKSMDDISREEITENRADIWLKSPIDAIDFTLKRNQIITTVCNNDVTNNNILEELKVSITPTPNDHLIFEAIERLNNEAPTFHATGGTHSAILSSITSDYCVSAEDVGRHNAVDKVLGSGFIDNVPYADCILASSGRLSGEIVLKAARAGVPNICSVSAPLMSGINVAKKTGIRLYGFVRAQRFNMYL